ncbi:MAG: glycosyltransferase [Acidobacteriaceae bacterium]
MTHFGVLSYKGIGHLNPLMALSRQLTARGHRVTFFLHPELEQRVLQNGLEFYPIDVSSRKRAMEKPNPVTRIGQTRAAVRRIAEQMEAFLHAYPSAIHAACVDALIVGEISLTGPTVAEMLHLPYFIVSTSIPHNFGWDAPRAVMHPGSWLDRLQRNILEVSILRMKGPLRRRLDQYRRRVGLRSIRMIGQSHHELAHITQWPQCLDRRQHALPKDFFYTGPFIDETARERVPFPWDRLDGRPLVYASLGTTRRADPAIFARIAEACSGLNLQLAISLGGRRDAASFTGLPGNPVVVSNAPQLEMIKRAQIVITHAGPNTVLETLIQGNPMVALPITLDQPAIAARLLKLGVAEVLALNRRSANDIREALMKVCNAPSYRETAKRLQTQILSSRGAARAADIIEDRLKMTSLDRPTGGHDDLPVTSR